MNAAQTCSPYRIINIFVFVELKTFCQAISNPLKNKYYIIKKIFAHNQIETEAHKQQTEVLEQLAGDIIWQHCHFKIFSI